MAATAGTAFVTIKPDMSGFGRELDREVGRSMARAEQTISQTLGRAGGNIASFGSGLTRSVTVPLALAAGGLGAWGLSVASATEQSQIAFENLLPAGTDVVAFMGDLTDFAKATPFDVATINQMAAGLLGVGVGAGEILPLLTGMGDAVAGFGGSAADVDMVNYAMKQVIGSGRAYTEDINQIATYVPTIWQEIAAQLGVTVDEARNMAKEGQIGSDVLVAAFEQPVGPLQNLTGMMEAQSGTLVGIWSTFKDTMAASLGEAITPLLPQIKTAITDLGAALGPALQAAVPVFVAIVDALVPVVEWITKMLVKFTELSEGQQKFIIYAGLGIAALGPFISIVGRVIQVFGGLAGVVKNIWTFIRVIMAIARVFGIIKVFVTLIKFMSWQVVFAIARVTVAMMTNPVILLIMAIVAAVALVAFLIWKYWDQIKAAFAWAWSYIQPILMSIWNFFVAIFNGIWQFLQTVWDVIITIFTTAFNVIWTALQIWFALITLPFRIFFLVVSEIAQAIWDFLVGVFQGIWDFIQPLWQALWDTVMAVVNTVWGFLSSTFTTIWNFIVGVFEGIKNTVSTVWDTLWGIVKGVVETVWGWVQTKFETIKNFIIGIFDTVKTTVSTIWDTISTAISTVVDGIKGVIDGLWSAIKTGINTAIGVLNGLIGGINTVIGGINLVPGAPDIPKIPTIPTLLAKGGIVEGPMNAIIGERGAEAVIPLSKLDAILGNVAGKQDQPIYITVKIGDEDITQMIEETTRTQQEHLARMLVGGRRL